MSNPVRVAENAAFLDLLCNGRFLLGLGSGYRPYEFEGMGVPFDERRDIQEEALPIIQELFTQRKITHKGKYFDRSEEHTSELQSLMRISYAVFCLKKKKNVKTSIITH